jgi:hypothetical protein
VTDDAAPIFERGDVVYGDEPFKGDEDARPWLVLSNHEGRPFHSEPSTVAPKTARRNDYRDSSYTTYRSIMKFKYFCKGYLYYDNGTERQER